MYQRLNSYWSSLKRDNATIGDQTRPGLINPASYRFVRQEGYVLDEPWVEYGATRTTPLVLMYSGRRSDHRTVASPESIEQALREGYRRLATVGYVWLEAPRQYARALKHYWNEEYSDSLLVGSIASEKAAVAAGYSFVGLEGWTSVPPQFPAGADYNHRNDAINAVYDDELNSYSPYIYWGMLRHGDMLHDMYGEHGGIITNENRYRDCMRVTEEALPTSDVEFVLRLAPSVTWWKEIALLDEHMNVISAHYVEGNNSPETRMNVSGSDVVGKVLQFSKAKSLGEHVRQYVLVGLSAKRGKRVVFEWIRDDEDTARVSLAWQHLSERLDQGDLIKMYSGPGTPGVARFLLSNTRRSRWWKQIELIYADRTEGAAVSTQDDRAGPVVLQVPNSALVGSRLLLSKAMALGIHTDLYEIGDLSGMADRFVDLTWLRDDLPDPDADRILEWRPGFRLLEEHWGIRNWNSVHCDGDIIRPRVEDLPRGDEEMMEFVLQTSESVSWWKALRLYNVFDDYIEEVVVEGPNRRSAAIRGRFDDFWWADLVFAKAKFLGKHEDKYDYQLGGANMARIGAAPGKRVVFHWEADDLPRPAGC